MRLARKKIGDKHWNRRVRKAIDNMDALFFFDHLYIGGGNGQRINRKDLGDVLDRITVVDNTAGILGGIKLWEGTHSGCVRLRDDAHRRRRRRQHALDPDPAGRLRQHAGTDRRRAHACTTSTRTACRRCSSWPLMWPKPGASDLRPRRRPTCPALEGAEFVISALSVGGFESMRARH